MISSDSQWEWNGALCSQIMRLWHDNHSTPGCGEYPNTWYTWAHPSWGLPSQDLYKEKINLSLQQERNTVASENEGYEKRCEVFMVYYWCWQKEMCNVGNLQQKAANMNTITQWSDCRHILDASQSAQWVLPGTHECMVCIELLSTELLGLDFDFLISFPCNRNQKLRTKFWCPKYKISLGITQPEPQ